ncbi:MAG: NAD(P)-binding protein [Planctomycetaceae bacterium]
MNKQKIAILGGGTGALSAAFGLTSQANWQDRYEVTVYQVGWRLGGKGASGRNPAVHQRIEEHGLHVWAGFYENAFRVMRECYQELNRQPSEPLATVWDAFKPKSNATLTEFIRNQWLEWPVSTPTNHELPGEDCEMPTIGCYVRMLLDWVLDHLEESGLFGHLVSSADTHGRPSLSDALWHSVQTADRTLRAALHPSIAAHHPVLDTFDRGLNRIGDAVTWLLHGLRRLLATAVTDLAHLAKAELQSLVALIGELRDHVAKFAESKLAGNDEFRRVWLFVDFGFATVTGLIADGVLWHGFASIDDVEWRTWLQRHGASATTANSVITRATYDYIFGYIHGDVNQASVGAGTCTHGLMRLTLTYKGALFWEMQAGMGDTVFGPLALVLKQRGVKFQYFHRADALRLSPTDATVIEAIDLGIQMQTLGGQEYQPLIDVQGLPCWPSEPLFDQLVDGDKLKQSGANLESPWTDWPDAAQATLQRGRDFDIIVLGISIAALKSLTPELMAANPRWADMVNNVLTTQTQAVQVWLKQDAQQLGWKSADPALVTGYADDLNTWGDLSHLLQREDWPAAGAPRNESYFCGPLRDPAVIPPPSDHNFPNRMDQQVKAEAINWLNSNVGFLLPVLGANGQMDWNQLVDDSGATGAARFDSQYWRANIAPTERYVISAAGTTKYRLKSDGSGFQNLFLAGDWTDTAINAGCIEAAVMSGLAASQAICGSPAKIIGATGGAER